VPDLAVPLVVAKPLALLDDGLHLHYANAAFARLFTDAVATLEAVERAWRAEAALASLIAHVLPRVPAAGHTVSARWNASPALAYQVHLARLPDGRLVAMLDEIPDAVRAADIQAGARAYLEGVLNHLDRAVLVVDVALRVTFMNAAQEALLQHAGAAGPWLDYVGQPIDVAFPILDAAAWRDLCGDVVACGRSARLSHVRAPGAMAPGPIEVHVLPMALGNGDVLGAVIMTEVQTSGGVDAASGRAAPLARALQHDVNNPLTTIVAAVEALQRDDSLAPVQRERVAAIRASALRIAEAVRVLASHAGDDDHSRH